MTALLDSAGWRLWRALRPVPEGNSNKSEETMTGSIATLPAAATEDAASHLPPALGSTRERLRASIARETIASREAGALGEKIGRLQAVLSDETAAMARTAECRDLDRKRLGDWLANPVGPRPQKSAETDEAETNQLAFAVDAAAARATLGAIEAQQRAAIERREQATRNKVTAVADVILDEFVVELLTELRCKIEVALSTEARLRGLVTVLRQDEGVARLAEHIETAIRATRASAAAPRDDEWALHVWQSLAADPAHGLGRP
jgi:hypothetical protein